MSRSSAADAIFSVRAAGSGVNLTWLPGPDANTADCRRARRHILSIQCDGAPGQRIQIDAERIYAEPRLGLP